FFTSAKTGTGVDPAFDETANVLVYSGPVEYPPLSEIPIHTASLTSVVDEVFYNFTQLHSNGDLVDASPILGKQVKDSGVILEHPTRESVINLIDRLADVETSFHGKEKAKEFRIKMIAKVDDYYGNDHKSD
ncbi:MAG: hypothetical protein PHU12_03790, partial [Candidatus Aenigmarchaeota archaeon]|nr:hypothetical protein [Candidatus Aenigmarchaeota archaeon]